MTKIVKPFQPFQDEEYIPGDSLTEQGHTPLTNVNAIVKQATMSGHLPGSDREWNASEEIPQRDLETNINLIAQAKTQFELMPEAVRKRFGYDYNKYLAYVADDKNIPQMRKDGWIPEPPSNDETPPADTGDTPPATPPADTGDTPPADDPGTTGGGTDKAA